MGEGLDVLVTKEEATLEVTDFRGDPIGVTLVLAGPYSERLKVVQQAGERRSQNFLKRIGGNFRRMTEKQNQEYSDLIRRNLEERQQAAVVGWKSVDGEESGQPNTVKLAGQLLECTPENVKKVFDAVPFIRDQVAQMVNDEGNFTQR